MNQFITLDLLILCGKWKEIWNWISRQLFRWIFCLTWFWSITRDARFVPVSQCPICWSRMKCRDWCWSCHCFHWIWVSCRASLQGFHRDCLDLREFVGRCLVATGTRTFSHTDGIDLLIEDHEVGSLSDDLVKTRALAMTSFTHLVQESSNPPWWAEIGSQQWQHC